MTVLTSPGGETRGFAEWCRHFGVNFNTAYRRFSTGRPFEEIFQKGPMGPGRRGAKIRAHGEVHTIAEWARRLGLGKTCLYRRLKKGLAPDEAMVPGRTWHRVNAYVRRSVPPVRIFLEKDGERLSLLEWSERLGLVPNTVYQRVHRAGGPDKADPAEVLAPPRRPRTYTVGGKEMTLTEMAAVSGMNRGTLRERLKAGESPERAMSPGPRPSGRYAVYAYKGEALTVAEWARKFGLTPSGIYQRMRVYDDPDMVFSPSRSSHRSLHRKRRKRGRKTENDQQGREAAT